MCIFAIFLRRYLVKTVVKSKRRYLLNGSCDFFLVFTKRSSGGSSFWWTPWFMVEIFFGNNTSLVRCENLPNPMVCLFLLPVIAKIPTDCLILIGCWKVSLNLIGCLKKLSRRTKCSTPLDWGGSGLYAGAHKKFVPFFWTHFISWQSVECK